MLNVVWGAMRSAESADQSFFDAKLANGGEIWHTPADLILARCLKTHLSEKFS